MMRGEKQDERVRAEEKYKTLVETAADGILTLDLLGRFTFVNPAAEKVSGYTKEELVGKHFRELLPLEYLPVCLNTFQETIRGKETPPIEIELITKEGERVPLELLGRPVKRGGKIVEILGIARDITERKRAEEALRKSEERYKKQFEEAMDAIFIADAKTGIVIDCNRVALELVGREKSELVGKHQRILHPPEEIEGELSRTFKQHLKEKEGQVLETQVITKEGEIKDVAIKASIFELEGKKMLLGIFRDITERKRAEEEIRRRNEELAALNAIAMTVTSTLDLHEVLRTIQERVMKLLGEKYPPLFSLFDEENQTFEVVLTLAQEGPLRRAEKLMRMKFEELTFPLPRLKPALREALLAGKPYVNSDGSDILAPQVRRRLTQGAQRALGVKCIVALPLWAKGKLIATMVLFSQRERVPDEETELLSAIANQAAIAIENAKLYEAERKRATQLALINKVSKDSASSLEAGKIMQKMARSIQESFNYYNVSLFSVDEERREVVIQGVVGGFEHIVPGGYRQSLDKGIIGFVARTGRRWLANDVSQDPYYIKGFLAEVLTKSELCVPIKMGDKVIGAIDLQSVHLDAFDETDITTLETLSDQIAIAIENARLYEDTCRHLEQATALREIDRAISSTLDLSEVLDVILGQLERVIPYHSAAVFLLSDDIAKVTAGRGYPDREQVREVSLSVKEDDLFQQILEENQPLVLDDAQADGRFQARGGTEYVRSWMGVPLIAKGKVIGFLTIDHREPGVYNEKSAEMAMAFAAQAAIAIENAQLYEEVKRRLAEISALHRVSEVINSTLDLQEVFQRVVEELYQTFGYRLVDIYLLEEQGLTLQANVGFDAETAIDFIPMERGVIGRVARTRQPAFVRDVTKDPDYITAYPDITCEICVPIARGDTLLGVLNVESGAQRPLTESDLQLLLTLSSHIGVAIENARLYQETKRLAITDGLTGLYNSRYFYETLEKEIQRSERYHRSVSLTILDIDDFKRYNDTYGHLAGDDLLRELASLLQETTRGSDTVARYGGEEFTTILPETDTEGAALLAQRIQGVIRKHPFAIRGTDVMGKITVSLGVATYPHHADSGKELVDAADKALLGAKRGGKDQLYICRKATDTS